MTLEEIQKRVCEEGRGMAIDFSQLGLHLGQESHDANRFLSRFIDPGIELSLEVEQHVICHPMRSAVALMASKWLFGTASRMAFPLFEQKAVTLEP